MLKEKLGKRRPQRSLGRREQNIRPKEMSEEQCPTSNVARGAARRGLKMS